MTINLDDLRKYLNEEGPKKVINKSFSVIFWLKKKFGGKEYSEFDQKYHYKKDERLKEVLLSEGQIILSGSDTTIIMYNEKSKRLERANFDIMTGQPFPDSNHHINHDEIIPASLLNVVYFCGHEPNSGLYGWGPKDRKKQAAGFLEKLIELSEETPFLEIGLNRGDSFNRYFSARKYIRKP